MDSALDHNAFSIGLYRGIFKKIALKPQAIKLSIVFFSIDFYKIVQIMTQW